MTGSEKPKMNRLIAVLAILTMLSAWSARAADDDSDYIDIDATGALVDEAIAFWTGFHVGHVKKWNDIKSALISFSVSAEMMTEVTESYANARPGDRFYKAWKAVHRALDAFPRPGEKYLMAPVYADDPYHQMSLRCVLDSPKFNRNKNIDCVLKFIARTYVNQQLDAEELDRRELKFTYTGKLVGARIKLWTDGSRHGIRRIEDNMDGDYEFQIPTNLFLRQWDSRPVGLQWEMDLLDGDTRGFCENSSDCPLHSTAFQHQTFQDTGYFPEADTAYWDWFYNLRSDFEKVGDTWVASYAWER